MFSVGASCARDSHTVSNSEKGRDGAQQRFPIWCLLHFAFVFVWLACSEEKVAQPPEGMVLIPAGTFQMGSTTGDVNEVPVHTVELDAFYIDQHEVTNAEVSGIRRCNRTLCSTRNRLYCCLRTP